MNLPLPVAVVRWFPVYRYTTYGYILLIRLG